MVLIGIESQYILHTGLILPSIACIGLFYTNDDFQGGFDELMKGAGKDATKIFNEVHRWVNYESMLQVSFS